MSGVPSGGNPVKNIIIGVVTTVIAYVIVHYIFDKKSGKEDQEKSKQATESAWNSVNDYITYSNEKFKTIACFSCDEQLMKKELIRELDNNSNSLKNLKESKNIDEKMLSVIDRTIQEFNDLKPVYSEYFDSLTFIKQLPMEEQLTQSARFQLKYLEEIAHIQSRDSTEFQNYLRDVNKKFKTNFKLKDNEPEFRPEAITGKWKIECTFDIEFKSDGSLVWTEGANEFKGKWKFDKKDLKIHLDNDQQFTYSILILSRKMMVYYNPDINAYMAGCPE